MVPFGGLRVGVVPFGGLRVGVVPFLKASEGSGSLS